MVIERQLILLSLILCIATAVQFPPNPTSEMSADERNMIKDNRTLDQSDMDNSAREVETDMEEVKEKKYLDDAMKTILDPETVIEKKPDVVQDFKIKLQMIERDSQNFEVFMDLMDNLSLEVCKSSQNALWAYVTDINNEAKKNKMVLVAAEEDEIKKHYWNTFKKKYLMDDRILSDPKIQRKIRIIKERGTNVQMPESKQREEIDTMQRIWSRVSICTYNATNCNAEDSGRTMSDVIAIFKTSNDTKELAYYWKAYRDMTGKKIRPIFKDYVSRMNMVAKSENFTDAGDMWRYAFEDSNFTQTVQRIWTEIKPIYDEIHKYVRLKLKSFYKQDLQASDNMIPAHLLGNIWAQEWQAIYKKVVAYPEFVKTNTVDSKLVKSKELFDIVDEFHLSLGFESAKDAYVGIKDTMNTANCLPSSHDMCDGVNYKIKWCGDKVEDITVGLSRAARLLGHVQYFKHYHNLPPLYRDGPNPAFHDAISDIVAMQLTSPEYLKKLSLVNVETGPEVTINHLLWMSLEKFPLMAFAYVLDRWRWDIFVNTSLDNWNEHWWELRTKETGISPPVPRNESDLDPAAKYHVVSHVQYITYLVSHVLEFQIMLSLCRAANHTGPLHECSLHGVKEAGKRLSDGMSLGASEDWRTVLKVVTGETELNTEGIIQYFAPLAKFLKEENKKLALQVNDMDSSTPIIVGLIVIVLVAFIIVLYFAKRHGFGSRFLSACGLSKNGSLDIATNEMPQAKNNEINTVCEDKL